MKIKIDDDFDLNKIIYSGQCFRPREISDGLFRFITRENVLYIKADGDNSFDISCDEDEWNLIWRGYFDIARKYKSIRKSIPDDDKYMKKCAEAGAGIRILKQDEWEMLISFIISQRKSIPAIRSAVEKLCLSFGKRLNCDDELYAFPTPDALAGAGDDELAACGLGYRLPYIRCAAESVLRGDIVLCDEENECDAALNRLDDESLFLRLKTIKGVGDKVANCVELFAYGRTGRAPVDTWINKVINTEYGGVNPFPAYGENAGIMQQYVFYYAQHLRKDF